MIVNPGSTGVVTYFMMRLTADGAAATGLTATDFDLQFTRSGAAAAAKVDATLNGNGVDGAHSDSTVIEVDATSSPGLYRVDWVDAAFASGVREVILSVKVATAFTEHLRVELSKEIATLESLANETRSANVLDQLKTIIAVIESQRSDHIHQPSTGNIFFINSETGDTTGNGATGGISDPIDTLQDAHDAFGTDFGHDLYIMVAGEEGGTTEHAEDVVVSNGYSFIRGPGRDLTWMPTANNTIAISATGDGCELSGFQVEDFNGTGSQVGIQVTDADFTRLHNLWLNDTRGDGINILRGTNTFIGCCVFQGTGVSGSGQGIHVVGTAGSSNDTVIHDCHFANTAGDSILIEQGTTNDTEIHHCTIHNSGGWGINIGASSNDAQVHNNTFGNNSSGDINDGGTDSIIANNEQWAKQSLLVYANFAIHIDTVNGVSGTAEGINGTRGNPVDNLANAVTLEAGLGFKEYHLHGTSAITLVSAHSNWVFHGQNGASIDLGGVNTNGSHFECLTITGDADGNDITTRFCKLQSLTNFIADAQFCLLIDDVTESAGDHYWFQCASGVAGVGTPHIDVDGDDANARNNHLRGWLGGVEIRTHTSTDTTSFDCPAGQIVVAASCTGGTIAMRGNINITDNAAEAVTFSENAAVNISKIGTGITGSGADIVTVNVKVGGVGLENAQVWITTDAAGANIFAGTSLTDSNGDVTFLLDDGNTYFLWAQKGGFNLPQGESFVASAD